MQQPQTDVSVLAVHNNALRVQHNELLCLSNQAKHVYIDYEYMHGEAKQWWLHRSLKEHSRKLASLGIQLHVIRANDELLRNAETIYIHDHPTVRNGGLGSWLKVSDGRYKLLNNGLLLSPGRAEQRTKTGFVNNSPKLPKPDIKPVESMQPCEDLMHNIPDVDWPVPKAFNMWEPGEEGAWKRLKQWASKVTADEYGFFRGYPSSAVTSRMSPHIANGEITPQQIQEFLGCEHPLIQELYWREFKHDQVNRRPYYRNQEIKIHLRRWKWSNDISHVKAWQKGLTGYRIVDAGMQELWQTGFMDNRVRMIVASFLVCLLNVDWRIGAEWFMYTLVDADEAINCTQWQNAFNSGLEYQPANIIMSPTRQETKFDAASYIKQWNRNDVNIKPIVDYEQCRKACLVRYNEALATFRSQAQTQTQTN
ncbi:MAG: FAD-binding domain-containing protein [Waterburya sp.]